MKTKDVMSTPVVTVTVDTPVKEVAETLLRHGISGVPVVNEMEELVGIVTEGDLVELETMPDPRQRILPLPARTEPVPRIAADVMTKDVVVLPEEADVAEAARLMLEKHVKRIPIVSGTRVVGIVARRDLLRVLARSDGEIQEHVEKVLNDEVLVLGRFGVKVDGGVVTLFGNADRAGRRLTELLARSVPGVLDVQFVEVNP